MQDDTTTLCGHPNATTRNRFVTLIIIFMITVGIFQIFLNVKVQEEEAVSSAFQRQQRSNADKQGNSHPPATVFTYSPTLPDRSGSQALEMLTAHAWSYRMGFEYRGTCGRHDSGSVADQHSSVLSGIGLDADEFAYNVCPEKELAMELPPIRRPSPRHLLLPRDFYLPYTPFDFTQEWRHYITNMTSHRRRIARHDLDAVKAKLWEDRFNIVVHVRRGDVHVCYPFAAGSYSRFFPDSYFLELVERYVSKAKNDEKSRKRKINVIVFSERGYDFHLFSEKGYDVRLNSTVEEAARDMADADILIMSPSGFSLAPAIVSEGTVVYTPMWHPPLPGWTIVGSENGDDVLTRALDAIGDMRKEKCPLEVARPTDINVTGLLDIFWLMGEETM